MLKILQARLQQYVNRELPDIQAGFRNCRGTRDQIANIRWTMEKAREFQKNIYFCCIEYAKAFDCVDHKKLWKMLQEMGIPDHLTCLLRNLYAGQEATVRTEHGTTDWVQIGKEYVKAVYCHPAYLTSMQSTSWETLGWKKYKRESRLLGEISITSDMQMIPPLWQKGAIKYTSFSWASKSLQMVTAARKWKDSCFHLVKAIVLPVVMYGYESWTIKKAQYCRIDAFDLGCWRPLRAPWTARRSN